jgi:hypothetical protein
MNYDFKVVARGFATIALVGSIAFFFLGQVALGGLFLVVALLAFFAGLLIN